MVLTPLGILGAGREGKAWPGWGPLESAGSPLWVSWGFLFTWGVAPGEHSYPLSAGGA